MKEYGEVTPAFLPQKINLFYWLGKLSKRIKKVKA